MNVYGLNGSELMWCYPLGQAAPKTRDKRKREFNCQFMQECIALQSRGLRIVLVQHLAGDEGLPPAQAGTG